MSKREEIEARRAKRREELEAKRSEQRDADAETIDQLEVELGVELRVLVPKQYHDGLPACVAYRPAEPAVYKRLTQQLRRAKDNFEQRGAATDLLADSCWIYPQDKETRKAMLDVYPGILHSIAVEVVKLADLEEQEEGKG